MKYQKLINLLDNNRNQISKFWTKKWIEITDRNGVQIRKADLKLQC